MRVKELYFSAEVEEKVWKKHHLTPLEVEYVVINKTVHAKFERDSQHGYRARVETYNSNGNVLVVWLKPINLDKGSWSVITTYLQERYSK